MPSVKVAVRVRPFNTREINHGSSCIITMEGNSTGELSCKSSSDAASSRQGHYVYTYYSRNTHVRLFILLLQHCCQCHDIGLFFAAIVATTVWCCRVYDGSWFDSIKQICTECVNLTFHCCLFPLFFAAIEHPKMPTEAPKTFSFDYSYWTHTNVSLRLFSMVSLHSSFISSSSSFSSSLSLLSPFSPAPLLLL